MRALLGAASIDANHRDDMDGVGAISKPCRTLFVHAGLHPKWARLGCDGINRRAAQELSRAVPRAGGEPQPAFAPMLSAADGPVWWRGLAEGDEAEACALLDESLSHIKAARMVVGHTIQERGRMRLRRPPRDQLGRLSQRR